jgi:2-polyprenyl-3-methyl-5-hydroxy-6-metoxy-1,4-benzoquinol methylase
MSQCCVQKPSTDGINATFSKAARWYAWKFRRFGPEKVQRLLLQTIQSGGVAGKSILDIGCGVGALHLSLLKDGASSATGIDVAEGMIEKARTLAAERDSLDRTTYFVGDFTGLSDSIGEADITLMDKVVCCYEDLAGLVKQSASKTKSVYALSHPKKSPLVKFIYTFQIALAKLTKGEFRTYWHDWEKMKDDILGLGFELTFSGSTFFWQALVFRKISP